MMSTDLKADISIQLRHCEAIDMHSFFYPVPY